MYVLPPGKYVCRPTAAHLDGVMASGTVGGNSSQWCAVFTTLIPASVSRLPEGKMAALSTFTDHPSYTPLTFDRVMSTRTHQRCDNIPANTWRESESTVVRALLRLKLVPPLPRCGNGLHCYKGLVL
ncbi:hypothetical protein AcV5_000413 [Taiwanofungus camphoratus]|nr:hypothetical protein AcV5_000413 [Antrodia cinnamomea]